MSEFDDLFDRKIPREAVEAYASELQKIALSTGMMARAASGAHPERLAGARNKAISAAHSLATRGGDTLGQAKAYRKQQRFAGVLEDALERSTNKTAASEAQLGRARHEEKLQKDHAKKNPGIARIDKKMDRAIRGSGSPTSQALRSGAAGALLPALAWGAHRMPAREGVIGAKSLSRAFSKLERGTHTAGRAVSLAVPAAFAGRAYRAASLDKQRGKEAVSTEWVANAARAGGQAASRGRLNEVAGRSMKGVLNAAKGTSPLRQAHLDKRMSLRNGVLGAQASRADSIAPRAFQKAAGKLAAAVEQARSALAEPTAEQVMLQEQTGIMQQTAQENLALRGELEQSQAMLQQTAEEAETANAMAQQQEEQLQAAEQQAQEQQAMAQEQLMMAQEQATMAQQEAQQQAAEAAAQADGKMRLSIRIQQIRQQLADMASQDPVTEEGEQADPILTAGQQGMGDPSMDPAAAQDPAAAAAAGAPGGPPDPAAMAGGAPPTEAKPKPKAKPKSEPKKDEGAKAGPKTEIKIGSADKAKGLQRARQLLTGSRLNAMRKAPMKDKLRDQVGDAAEVLKEHAKVVGSRTGAGVAGAGTVAGGSAAAYRGIKNRDKEAGTNLSKAKGLRRVGELLTGSRVKALDVAAKRSGERALKMPLSTKLKPKHLGLRPEDVRQAHGMRQLDARLNAKGHQVGLWHEAEGEGKKVLRTRALAGGAAIGTASALSAKHRKKEAAPRDLAKETGLRRVGQLLTGSRARNLHHALEHNMQRMVNKPKSKVLPKGQQLLPVSDPRGKGMQSTRELAQHAMRDVRGTERLIRRNDHLLAALDNELPKMQKAQGIARMGVMATGGVAAAGGAGYGIHKALEKKATEEQVRSDARRAAGRAGVLPGALTGAAAARLMGRGTVGTAAGGLLGATAGSLHGRAGFNKREYANDLHMERALTKGKRERFDKEFEKKAEAELTDDDLTRLYGL